MGAAIALAPVAFQLLLELYKSLSKDPTTPAQDQARYAQIAAQMDELAPLIQAAPQPPVGSGR
jgi:hypothetical protein